MHDCRTLGIEVVLLRGNDRNRRRGFHNTYVFYRQLRATLACATPAVLPFGIPEIAQIPALVGSGA